MGRKSKKQKKEEEIAKKGSETMTAEDIQNAPVEEIKDPYANEREFSFESRESKKSEPVTSLTNINNWIYSLFMELTPATGNKRAPRKEEYNKFSDATSVEELKKRIKEHLGV